MGGPLGDVASVHKRKGTRGTRYEGSLPAVLSAVQRACKSGQQILGVGMHVSAAKPGEQVGALLRPARRGKHVTYENRRFAFLLNAPSLIAIVILVGYPITQSAWISLHKYNLKRPRVFEFVGLRNFMAILESEEFWAAL